MFKFKKTNKVLSSEPCSKCISYTYDFTDHDEWCSRHGHHIKNLNLDSCKQFTNDPDAEKKQKVIIEKIEKEKIEYSNNKNKL